MPVDNQIEPPQSFMAMYVTPGCSRPNAPQEVVLARYELCEDMACTLLDHAQTIAFKENTLKMKFFPAAIRACATTPRPSTKRKLSG